MNRGRYEALPAATRRAVDSICCEAWLAKFGPLWDKCDRPVREGLRPVSERYLDELSGKGFPNARAAYDKMLKLLGR
jgi:hypothetical protein